jgi:aureolysin
MFLFFASNKNKQKINERVLSYNSLIPQIDAKDKKITNSSGVNHLNFKLPKSKDRVDAEELVYLVKSSAAEMEKLFKRDKPRDQFEVARKLVSEDLEVFQSFYEIEKKPKITLSPNGKITSIFPNIESEVFSSNDQSKKNKFIADMVNNFPALFGYDEASKLIFEDEKCFDQTCRIKVSKEYNGIPSWDHNLIFTSINSRLVSIQGKLTKPNIHLNNHQLLTDDQIMEIAAKYFSVPISSMSFRSDVSSGIGSSYSHDYMGYKVALNVAGKGPYEIRINSRTKKVVESFSLKMSYYTNSTGLDLDDNLAQFRSYFANNSFYLMDDRFPEGNKTNIYDAGGDYFWPPESIANSSDQFMGWDKASVTAINFTSALMNYFRVNHDYNALENSKDLNVIVNAELDQGDVNNAYWISDLQLMAFGMGDGNQYRNFVYALDVFAHEVTHGIISSTSNLVYEYQPGALNESFADFFGTQVDNSNWDLGESVRFDGTPFRSMATPSLYDDPAHMSEYKYLSASIDHGGVHTNSGIPNRALYLLSEGLTNEGLGSSIGREKAGRLAWETMIGLNNRSSFDDAANLMIEVSEYIYGENSPEADATILAWNSVGLPAENTSISTSVNDNYATASHNTLIYLNPYYSVSQTNTFDNVYNLYAQILPNDSPNYSAQTDYGPLNSTFVLPSRPTVVNLSNGHYFMMYEGIDNEVYVWDSEYGIEEIIDLGFTISDITISTDGNLVAFVADDQPVIFTLNLQTNEVNYKEIKGPDFSLIDRTTNTVEYIDTVRFDPTSRKLIFDYLTCPFTSSSCAGDGMGGYWSIGIYDLMDDQVFYPFPQQDDTVNIGFPTFSNLNDQIVAFDMIIEDPDNFGQYVSFIMSYDLSIDDFIGLIGLPDLTDSKFGYYGMPSFSANDSGVFYSATHNFNESYLTYASFTDYSLASEDINNITIVNPYLGYFSYATPLTVIERKPSLSLEANLFDFGNVINNSIAKQVLCATNSDLFPITVEKIYSQTESFTWKGSGRTLSSGDSLCAELDLNPESLPIGNLDTTISLKHDGLNSPNAVNVKANIISSIDYDNDGYENSIDSFPNDPSEWLDTDLDGVGNNADDDDDNDGVQDSSDLFPLDAMEWVDFDLDGVGDNSDNDDDNDGVDDSVDAFPYDESKWSIDVPDDSSSASLTWDFDQNGVADALTDGLMMLRFSFGLTGTNVTNDAMADNSDMSSQEVISALNSAKETLLTDIDGNGTVDALTDGLMLLRFLFGLTGDNIIANAIGNEAARNSATDVAAYISDHMPN